MNDQPSTPIDINKIKTRAMAVITNPVDFFRTMPTTGGLKDPFLFVVVVGVIAAALQAIFTLFISTGAAIATLLFAPVLIGIFSFVGAAVAFAIWKLIGSTQNYEVAYRCVAYSSAIIPITFILSIIPYAGGVAGTAWGMYLAYVASIEVHRIAVQKAKLVWGVLFVISALIGIRSEATARRMARAVENFEREVSQEGFTPEEAGRIAGEFLKGLEKAAQTND